MKEGERLRSHGREVEECWLRSGKREVEVERERDEGEHRGGGMVSVMVVNLSLLTSFS